MIRFLAILTVVILQDPIASITAILSKTTCLSVEASLLIVIKRVLKNQVAMIFNSRFESLKVSIELYFDKTCQT